MFIIFFNRKKMFSFPQLLAECGILGLGSRVVDPDPDPYWIRIQLEAWIRIRNLNTDPDPDPGGQNDPQK
jgi:hypothetical protein